ncbi:MAG: hypothetical protein M3Y04_05040 [Actinomycetota bacterium]|nr:hypothetical protein [Actinomycetota bacterium]
MAVDIETDQVVLTADSPNQLVDDIKAAGLRNVMVIRAPTEADPLVVGPGRAPRSGSLRLDRPIDIEAATAR